MKQSKIINASLLLAAAVLVNTAYAVGNSGITCDLQKKCEEYTDRNSCKAAAQQGNSDGTDPKGWYACDWNMKAVGPQADKCQVDNGTPATCPPPAQ